MFVIEFLNIKIIESRSSKIQDHAIAAQAAKAGGHSMYSINPHCTTQSQKSTRVDFSKFPDI